MSSPIADREQPRWRLSLDEWAVAAGLLLAILVRFGLLKRVPW
jgi:hypothetical protein